MTKTKAPGLSLDKKACYAVMQARDVRFDGHFFAEFLLPAYIVALFAG